MELGFSQFRQKIEGIVPNHYLLSYDEEMQSVREKLPKIPDPFFNLASLSFQLSRITNKIDEETHKVNVDLGLPIAQECLDVNKLDQYLNITFMEADAMGVLRTRYNHSRIDYSSLPLPLKEEKVQALYTTLREVQKAFPSTFPLYQKIVNWDKDIKKTRGTRLLHMISPDESIRELASRYGIEHLHKFKSTIDTVLQRDEPFITKDDLRNLNFAIERVCTEQKWIDLDDYKGHAPVGHYFREIFDHELERESLGANNITFAKGLKQLLNETGTQNPLQKAA
jgi:hypothetical protein